MYTRTILMSFGWTSNRERCRSRHVKCKNARFTWITFYWTYTRNYGHHFKISNCRFCFNNFSMLELPLCIFIVCASLCILRFTLLLFMPRVKMSKDWKLKYCLKRKIFLTTNCCARIIMKGTCWKFFLLLLSFEG